MGTLGDRQIFAALAILAVSAGYSTAEWQVKKSTDALDPTKTSTYAISESKQPIRQFERDVQIGLIVSCQNTMGPRPAYRDVNRLVAILRFTETVATGERWIRWRIDEHEVAKRKTIFRDDGKVFYLSTTLGRDEVTEQLRDAKIMRVEADLPWAGNAVLEFDVSGGPATFGQIPCENQPIGHPPARR
jgi:hypothetical protein